MANDPDIINSDGELLAAIAEGDCDLGLTNHYYLGRALLEDPDFPVAPAWPDQDGAGAHANVSGGRHRRRDRQARGGPAAARAPHLRRRARSTSPPAASSPPTRYVPPDRPHRRLGRGATDPIAVNEAGPLLDDAVAAHARRGLALTAVAAPVDGRAATSTIAPPGLDRRSASASPCWSSDPSSPCRPASSAAARRSTRSPAPSCPTPSARACCSASGSASARFWSAAASPSSCPSGTSPVAAGSTGRSCSPWRCRATCWCSWPSGPYGLASPLHSNLFGDGLRIPGLRTTGGAIAILTAVLYPYVYILGRSAFIGQSAAVARGRSVPRPHLRPSRSAGRRPARPPGPGRRRLTRRDGGPGRLRHRRPPRHPGADQCHLPGLVRHLRPGLRAPTRHDPRRPGAPAGDDRAPPPGPGPLPPGPRPWGRDRATPDPG